jgi:hypothetical protein
MRFVFIYGNRTMKFIEIVLRRKEIGRENNREGKFKIY